MLAGRLREQLLDPEAEVAFDEDLVRAVAELEPEVEPRVPRVEAAASRISSARSSSLCTSIPISAAGTIPNGESAE